MKRILFLVVIGTACFNQAAQAQTFNDHSRIGGVADLTRPHVAWTNTNTTGGTTTGAPISVALTDIAAMVNPGTIVDVSLAIEDLTIANANDLVVTLTHSSGASLTLADGLQATNPPQAGGAVIGTQHSYSDVDVTFRNASSAFGQEGIATNTFSFVGVDNGNTSLDQLDVFDGLDPNANWTVNISTTNGTSATFGDITLGGFSQVTAAVPEPASMSLFALGMLGLGTYRRRRPKNDEEDA